MRKEFGAVCQKNDTLPIIGYLKSEVLDIPIYEYTQGEEQLCITMVLCGAPGAAVAHYYDIPLAQLLYAGDDVSGEE